MTERSAATRPSFEPVIPNAGGADEVGIVAQRSQRQLRFLPGYERATFADDFANPVYEQVGALHHAPAKNDRVGRKHGDQIREAKTEVAGFVLHTDAGQRVTRAREFADALGRQSLQVRIGGRRSGLHPGDHGRARCKRFPASAIAAETRGTCRINEMMTNLRMGTRDTSIKTAVKNDAPANAGSHGDVNQPSFVLTGAPPGLAERRGVRIVLHGYWNVEARLKIVHRILAFPGGKVIHITDFAGDWIDRAGGSDTDAGDFALGFTGRLLQQFGRALERRSITEIG